MEVRQDCFGTFVEVLRSRAVTQANDLAFVFLDHRGEVADQRTFAELDTNARPIASELTNRGLRGERILLVFPPGLDFIVALFGCFYAGCVAVPTPYLIGKRAAARIAAIVHDCRPAAVLTIAPLENDVDIRNAVRSNLADVAWICVEALDTASQEWIPRVICHQELALLQYTSGSTGAAKGVMLSHGNLIANNAMLQEAFSHSSECRGVSWLPLFHDMGLIGHVLQPVYVGALSVLMSPLSFLKRPIVWLKAVSDWRGTTSGGPTYGFELCTRMVRPEQAKALNLSAWNVAYCGSEMVRADVLHRFAQAFEHTGFRRKAFNPCYGLAEATLMVTAGVFGTGMRAMSTSPALRTAGGSPFATHPTVSCGQPWGDETIAIVDPQSGTPVADGKVGEIWVKGPNVGIGYWGKDEVTKVTFAAQLEDNQGDYLRTGDLGFVQGGELFLIGRLKDTIIIRGAKHAPEDIEATVAASHHGYATLAGAAFGVDVAGEERVVLIQELARSVKDRDQQTALELAFERVTHEHGLQLFDLVLVRPGAIPRTSSGKVQRHRCREIYQTDGFERLNAVLDLRGLGINRNTHHERTGS